MKCLSRNKSNFYLALYLRKEPAYDEYGNLTGSNVVYSNPKKYSANISAAKGEITTRQFGENESYDKVIVTDDIELPIDSSSVLWVDVIPQTDTDGSLSVDSEGNAITPYDYIVKKIAKSMNSIAIAISKVDISG